MFRILLFLPALILILSCSSTDSDFIRFAAHEQFRGQRELLSKAVRLFEKENPDCKVKLEFSGDPRKIYVELAAQAQPDLFMGSDDNFYGLVSRGALAELTDMIATNDLDTKGLYESCLDAFRYQEGLYGLPLNYSTRLLVINRKYFQETGLDIPSGDWSWDEYLNTARKLTRDTNADGVTDIYGTSMPSFRFWLHTAGGRILDPDSDQPLIDSEESHRAYKFLAQLYNEKLADPFIRGQAEGLSLGSFAEGRTAMIFIDSEDLVKLMNLPELDWRPVRTPLYDRSILPVSEMTVYGLFVLKHSRHRQDAFRLAAFLSSTRAQEILIRQGSMIPVRRNTAEGLFLKRRSRFAGFIRMEQYAYLKSVYRPYWLEVRDKVLPDIPRAWRQDLDRRILLKNSDEKISELIQEFSNHR